MIWFDAFNKSLTNLERQSLSVTSYGWIRIERNKLTIIWFFMECDFEIKDWNSCVNKKCISVIAVNSLNKPVFVKKRFYSSDLTHTRQILNRDEWFIWFENVKSIYRGHWRECLLNQFVLHLETHEGNCLWELDNSATIGNKCK